MKITAQQIRRIMPHARERRIGDFVRSFNAWSDTFGIDTPMKAAHYIGQVAQETGELRYLEEMADGRQYEGRKDLGNVEKGDGRRFKGRGYLQTTGRRNYQQYADSVYCRGDLMAHPERLARQPGCQKASMFFWMENGLNALAEKDDGHGVSRRINGGDNGMAQRLYYTRKAKISLGV